MVDSIGIYTIKFNNPNKDSDTKVEITHMSFIKELKSNQIVSQLILSRPMPISMHKIRVSLFMRRFSSNKLEDLVQNSANLNIKLNS